MGRWFESVDTPADQGLKTIAPSEVARHSRLNDCWIINKGHVYDLSDFILDHPGGEDLILQFAGKDIGDILDDPIQHVHSNSAYLLLEEYLIGKVPADYVPVYQTAFGTSAAPVTGRAAGAIFAESTSLPTRDEMFASSSQNQLQQIANGAGDQTSLATPNTSGDVSSSSLKGRKGGGSKDGNGLHFLGFTGGDKGSSSTYEPESLSTGTESTSSSAMNKLGLSSTSRGLAWSSLTKNHLSKFIPRTPSMS